MARKRTTIPVAEVQAMLQRMIDNTDHWNDPHAYLLDGRVATPAESARMVLASALSSILHETGNYHGFQHQEWLNGGYARWVEDGEPSNNRPYRGDQTKVTYYSIP